MRSVKRAAVPKFQLAGCCAFILGAVSLLVAAIVAPATAAAAASTTAGEPLKVVYAGFGRSGTHSLKAALENLGYKACHGHDISPYALGSHKNIADAIIDQDVERLLHATAALGYNATVELHAVFWKEIWKLRPDAKLIFIIRDGSFDSWFESLLDTYWTMAPVYRYPWLVFPLHQQLKRMFASYIAYDLQLEQDEALDMIRNAPNSTPRHYQLQRLRYDQYVREARDVTTNHPEQALLLDLKRGGYAQLCEFLGIAADKCPSEPFPHLSQRSEMNALGRMLRSVEIAVYVMLILSILGLLWMLWVFVGKGIAGMFFPTSRKEDETKTPIGKKKE
jgi:Sulfotransferase domain